MLQIAQPKPQQSVLGCIRVEQQTINATALYNQQIDLNYRTVRAFQKYHKICTLARQDQGVLTRPLIDHQMHD